MQPRLTRFDLLILLLVSLIDVEALEKLSRVAALTPNPIAMPFQQVSSSSWSKNDKAFKSPEIYGYVAQMDPKNRETLHHRDTQRGPDGKTISKTIGSSPRHSTTLLAEKLAQDALHSKEMQDTIRELTSLHDDHKKHQEISNETEKLFQQTARPQTMEHVAKTTSKRKGHSKHKTKTNRKHNKHRKRPRKHKHPKRRLKRRHLKKESSKTARKRKSRKSISRGRRRGLKGKRSSEKSVTCRRKRSNRVMETRKELDRTSRENHEPLPNGVQNSIDELSNFESTHKIYKRIPISRQDEKEIDRIQRKRSHMIAQLMITTTRDPNKKKPGDQGVEYSEYYNDNDNILLPDIRAQSKLDDVSKTLMRGQIRSVRETADGNLPDQNYYDSSNEQLLEEDSARSKRSDQKFVRVMEEPSNSMEYVDNTYEPAPAYGIVDNAKISQYLTSYNNIPDQSVQKQGDPYRVLNNPAVEALGMRQPPQNQFPSDMHAVFNQNPPVIESMPNKVAPNMMFSLPTKSNENPMMNNAQSVAPGQPPLLGNFVLSQLPQPGLTEGNLPYYPIKEIPLEYSTNPFTSPAAFPISTSPESEKISKLYAATYFTTISSPSVLNPASAYDTFAENGKIFGLATPDKAISVTPASPEATLATFRTTSSPSNISPASLDFSELFSQLQAIRPEMGAPKVRYFNENDGAENGRGPDQIEPIASRETAMEGRAVKKGKKKGSNVKKTDVQEKATTSEADDGKKHSAGKADECTANKAAKGGDYSLLPKTTSQASVSLGSSAPQPGNTTLMANETKAVANEILNEIIDELEELRLENPKNEQREGLPCRLTGSWVTTRAGVRIDMKVTNHSVQVTLDHLTPPITDEGLLNVTWNVTGFVPFKRGGPFTLLATNNHTKTLAVFVGACKVCQGIDTIEGSWTVSREPRDCRDFQMSINIFNEIFRRTRLYSEIKDKQLKHETQTSSTIITTSGNSSTSESTNTTQELSHRSGKSDNQTIEYNGME